MQPPVPALRRHRSRSLIVILSHGFDKIHEPRLGTRQWGFRFRPGPFLDRRSFHTSDPIGHSVRASYRAPPVGFETGTLARGVAESRSVPSNQDQTLERAGWVRHERVSWTSRTPFDAVVGGGQERSRRAYDPRPDRALRLAGQPRSSQTARDRVGIERRYEC